MSPTDFEQHLQNCAAVDAAQQEVARVEAQIVALVVKWESGAYDFEAMALSRLPGEIARSLVRAREAALDEKSAAERKMLEHWTGAGTPA